jgi:hypothetical protein
MFNFKFDDLIAPHSSHAAPVQSFCNSITTFFGRYRSLDAVARFVIRAFLSVLEPSANRLVYNGPQTMALDYWMFPDALWIYFTIKMPSYCKTWARKLFNLAKKVIMIQSVAN